MVFFLTTDGQIDYKRFFHVFFYVLESDLPVDCNCNKESLLYFNFLITIDGLLYYYRQLHVLMVACELLPTKSEPKNEWNEETKMIRIVVA